MLLCLRPQRTNHEIHSNHGHNSKNRVTIFKKCICVRCKRWQKVNTNNSSNALSNRKIVERIVCRRNENDVRKTLHSHFSHIYIHRCVAPSKSGHSFPFFVCSMCLKTNNEHLHRHKLCVQCTLTRVYIY